MIWLVAGEAASRLQASDSAAVLSRTRLDVGSISGKPVTLAELFSLVEFQTDLKFEYAVGELPLGAELIVEGPGAVPLGRLLTLVSSQHGIEFEMRDRRLHATMKRPLYPADEKLAARSFAPVESDTSPARTTINPEQVDRQPVRQRAEIANARAAEAEPAARPVLDHTEGGIEASSPITAVKRRKLPAAEFQSLALPEAVRPARNVAGPPDSWPPEVKGLIPAVGSRGGSNATHDGSARTAADTLVWQLQEITGNSGLSGATREKRISGLVRAAVSAATLDERDSTEIMAVTEVLVSAAVGAAPRFVDVIASAAAFTPSISRIERGTARIRAAAYAASRTAKK